jgi:hypothetical protein
LQRPRDAGVVAERLASYQAYVRERLRQAELERARVEVQALQQRKRRRLLIALVLAALLLLLGGAVVWWQQAEAEADNKVMQMVRSSIEADADVQLIDGHDRAIRTADEARHLARHIGASERVRKNAENNLYNLSGQNRARPNVVRPNVTWPANSHDTLKLAQTFATRYRQLLGWAGIDARLYAEIAAWLYADAFTAEPKLAADLDRQIRYNAACNAAIASAGQGKNARLVSDKAVGMFRRWALGWLRDDLTAYAKLAGQNNPAMKQEIQQRLVHWKNDSDLVSVRDGQALERLPENERDAWRAFWRDVDELLARVTKKDEPNKGHKGP